MTTLDPVVFRPVSPHLEFETAELVRQLDGEGKNVLAGLGMNTIVECD